MAGGPDVRPVVGGIDLLASIGCFLAGLAPVLAGWLVRSDEVVNLTGNQWDQATVSGV